MESFSRGDIKQIRKQVGLSQVIFASSLGVSKKTVEAWKRGRNTPEGLTRRLKACQKTELFLLSKHRWKYSAFRTESER